MALRLVLVAAALAAVAVLTGLFSDAVRYACVGVVAGCALVVAPVRRREGGGWWPLLGAGAALLAAGAGLRELSETVGGLVTVAGGAFVVIAATIGFPAD